MKVGPFMLLVIASVSLPAVSSARGSEQKHLIRCSDSPIPGIRPASMECAFLVRKRVNTLPAGPVVWRLETFPTVTAARAAASADAAVVKAASKIWLMTLGRKGDRSRGATFVAEVGPLPIPRALRYEFLIAEANTDYVSITRNHIHSGPEAWFLLAGDQCLETPSGRMRLTAGHGGFVAADTPMRLTTGSGFPPQA